MKSLNSLRLILLMPRRFFLMLVLAAFQPLQVLPQTVQDGFAYVPTFNQLYKINVSNPSSPSIVMQVAVPIQPTMSVVDAERVYVAFASFPSGQVREYAKSNLGLLKEYAVPGFFPQIALDDESPDHIWVTTDRLYRITRSTSTVTQVSTISAGSNPAVDKTRVYFMSGQAIQIVDKATLTHVPMPFPCAFFFPFFGRILRLEKGYLLILNDAGSLFRVSTNDLSVVKLLSVGRFTGTTTDFAFTEQTVAVVAEGGLFTRTFQLFDRSTGVKITEQSIGAGRGVARLGTNAAYMTLSPFRGNTKFFNATTGSFLGSVDVLDGRGAGGDATGWYKEVIKDPDAIVLPTGMVVINGGAAVTSSTTVTLTLTFAGPLTCGRQMQIAVDGVADTEPFEDFVTTKVVTLPPRDGVKTVAVRLRNLAGYVSGQITDDILLSTNQLPVANAGPDQTVSAGATCEAIVTLDGSASSHPDGDPLTYTWTLNATELGTGVALDVTVPLGSHTIVLTVDDGNGGTDTDEVIINVIDTTPPTITVAEPLVLWPPNHRYVEIKVDECVISVTDNCAGSIPVSAVNIGTVSSDEPENAIGLGDGNTFNDIVIASDCKSVQLRAERDGRGNGRVYTITVEASDPSGNVGTAVCKVFVPHSQTNSSAIDDGAAYTVVSSCGDVSSSISATGENPPQVESETVSTLPSAFRLENYPNPFNPSTTIQYDLPERSVVTLKVYDVMGREVAVLVNGYREAGRYSAVFNAELLPSGVYLFRLQTSQQTLTRRMVLAK